MMKTTDAAALYKNRDDEMTAEAARCETERTGAGRQSLRTRIAQQPFFRGFSDEHIGLFTESAKETDFEPGEAILVEGSEADRFYLILEGRVVLGAELEDRGIVPVQTLGPGDGLGWSWLFAPYRLHLSARALAPTRMIYFHGNRLRDAAEQDHEFGYQLMKRITEVVTRRLRGTQQRLVECTSMRTLFNP